MTHDLQRFVEAQDSGGTYERALAELRAGRKTSHWMWFVFPQIAGLGQSEMSQRYAIASLEEARAYLDHPVLGPRLVECSRALLEHRDKTAREILGEVDTAKLRSSMTLFSRAALFSRAGKSARPQATGIYAVPRGFEAFGEVLDRYFGGESDAATELRL